MPSIKAILGHVSVETVVRKRICYRHRSGKGSHDILKGESCLVVHDPAGGGSRNYCGAAAADILAKAQADLDAVRRDLCL